MPCRDYMSDDPVSTPSPPRVSEQEQEETRKCESIIRSILKTSILDVFDVPLSNINKYRGGSLTPHDHEVYQCDARSTMYEFLVKENNGVDSNLEKDIHDQLFNKHYDHRMEEMKLFMDNEIKELKRNEREIKQMEERIAQLRNENTRMKTNTEMLGGILTFQKQNPRNLSQPLFWNKFAFERKFLNFCKHKL